MPTLDWLNRDAAFCTAANVPHRLLQAVSTHGDGDARNLLVQGDNLKALKALLPLYRAQVKCIFIDPPYNTKSAFEHYDDNLEHSQWLSMMLPRLQLLREFLRDDGSIWVTIDDHEGHHSSRSGCPPQPTASTPTSRPNCTTGGCWWSSTRAMCTPATTTRARSAPSAMHGLAPAAGGACF